MNFNTHDSWGVLDEAKSIVYGAREDAYGHPKEDFARTAKLWSEILQAAVSERDVALCMIALKLGREVNKHSRDNLVDIAGYVATIERLDEPTEINISTEPNGRIMRPRMVSMPDGQLAQPLWTGDIEDACRT